MSASLKTKLLSISRQIKKDENSFWGFNRNDAAALKKTEKKLLIKYLREIDPRFEEVFRKNLKLLQNNITIKGIKPEFLGRSISLDGYEGKMMKNGLIYLDAKTSLCGVFASSLIGEINAFGDVVLKQKENNPRYSELLVTEYNADTDDDGNLLFTISHGVNGSMLGRKYMSKIIYNPFNGDKIKQESFMINRTELINKIRTIKQYFRDNA